jgi:NAD(P)-dependent dehydrogenase (short-subunit alcohol dehydrogenase family)
MDLQLAGKVFIVTGAGSGFGNAIARTLANERAEVIAISRTLISWLHFRKCTQN